MSNEPMFSIIIPTRGRPKRLKETWDSIFNTVSDPSRVEIVIAADDDDPETVAEVPLLAGMKSVLIVRPRMFAVPKWAEAYKSASGKICMLCGDDIIFRTPDWDKKVEAAFDQWPDRIGLVCVAEGIWNGRLATNIFLSREWINALGYFVADGLRHVFVDQWLDEIAQAVGRRVYLPDVMAEHLHPMKHPQYADATYAIQDERIHGNGRNIKDLDKEFFYTREAAQMRQASVCAARDAIAVAAMTRGGDATCR
jgi:glycosyltransferase involved in cell wall biosynthesis